MVFDGLFDALFGWAIAIDPLFGVVFVAFVLTLLITLAYKHFTDQHLLQSIKERTKKMQKEMKGLSGDMEALKKKQSEMMELQMKMMMQTLKPMLITMLPIILVFAWLRTAYEGVGDIFWIFGWLGSYIIFSIVFSIVLRKLLKVH